MEQQIRKAQVSEKANELMSQIIPQDAFESFKELPLKDRVVGLGIIAQMTGENEVAQMAQDFLGII